MTEKVDYEHNVFISCPSDDDYNEIFNAILFVVHRCGFALRCSREYENWRTTKVSHTIKLIEESQYSIHDLSRMTLGTTSDVMRFNMSLELGICIGGVEFGKKKQRSSKYLIIESDSFLFKEFVPDLFDQDVKSHNDLQDEAIKIVRNWLSAKTNGVVPSVAIIMAEYKRFLSDLPYLCAYNHWDKDTLGFHEYSALVTNWLVFE